jgi:protein MpaA
VHAKDDVGLREIIFGNGWPRNSHKKLPCVFAALREILRVQKLGKNLGGYLGETIDIRAVLREVRAAAQTHGWSSELFYKTGDLELFALHRKPKAEGQKLSARIYISAGIHGDEPAGPLAALRLIQENQWPSDAELWLLPCLNPEGFVLNTRENAGGIDLNRDYRNPQAAETRAHIAWLERQPKFELYLCLHEDWESHGFYLYEQNPDSKISLAEKMIEAVQKVCPIDLSEIIEDRAAQNGIVRPNISPQERPLWPEALYLISYKARQGYTLEAPSDFSLPTRVNALVAAVNAALKS